MRQGSDALKQVLVANPYKLIASVENPDGSFSDVPDSGSTYQATPSNVFKTIEESLDMSVRCVDANTGAPAPQGSCFFALNLAPGSDNGGHLHTDSPRPLILSGAESDLDIPVGSNATAAPLSVDTYGGKLSYTSLGLNDNSLPRA
ncbi:MAG: hypothetical protein HY074_07295 [Deltaproteobacteria bacterium]|nr:hypothetical protein [Deltaproteobacteria bacterium]